jgi:hypothetical protein
MQMEQIRIDDGSKSYMIVNQDGKELGVFTFNPVDVRIVEKYNAVIEQLNRVTSELRNSEEDTAMILGRISRELIERMNELFGYDTGAFWSICDPLSPLQSGEFYIESVLNGIGAIIERESGARLKKVQKRMESYTAPYDKK